MLGDLMGNMEEKQNAMKAKLQQIELEEKLEGVTITANAAREILNVTIDSKYQSAEHGEELEDILVVAMNNLLAKISEEEARESQSMISDMLPPGMAGLFGG